MRSRSIRCAALFSIGVFLCAAERCAAQTVGRFGDPERIVIEGAQRFSADEIRAELLQNTEVLAAAHPLAQLVDYTRVLADRVRDGYWHSGFPDVKVTARLDWEARKIAIAIDEGPQYIAGEIQVLGAQAIDVPRLVAWMQARQPSASAKLAGVQQVDGTLVPRWVDKKGAVEDLDVERWWSGKPAGFGKTADEWRSGGVKRALADQGFPQAKFEAAMSRDESSHTATLIVLIEEEGPATKIDRIDVTGSDRDTPVDVIQFLGVQTGQRVTETECAAWTQKLWASGRYFEQEVKVAPGEKSGDPTVLKIRLVDYMFAPPLRAPLSADEELVLKCREWVLAAIERGDVMVVRGELYGMHVELATARQAGVLCLLEPLRSVVPVAPEEPPIERIRPMLFAATPGELFHAYSGGNQILRVPLSRAQILFNFSMGPSLDPKNATQKFSFTLGVGVKTQLTKPDAAPVIQSITIAPVTMLGLLNQPEAKTSNQDGVLTIDQEGSKYKIDRATGKLLEYSIVKPETEEKLIAISFEQRSFADCLASATQKLGPAVAEKPNAFQSHRPLSSSVEFMCNSPVLDWKPPREYDEPEDELFEWLAHMGAAKKLLAGDVLQPLDQWLVGVEKVKQAPRPIEPTPRPLEQWLAGPNKVKGQAFSIPWSGSAIEAAVGADASSVWGILLGGRAIRGAEWAFPRDSWPWTLTRGMALFSMQKTQHLGGDLDALFKSKHIGPVGRLVTATLLERINGASAGRFAMSGIENLSMSNFRLDYASLLDQKQGAGQLIARVAEVLRELDDSEAEELGHALLGKHGNLLVVAARYLREHKDEPLEKTMPRALDQAWSAGLSDLVAEQLKTIYLRNLQVAREKQQPPT